MKGIKHLTEGPILRQLFLLATPIMATSFIQMAYSLTDIAWVGRLGSEAIAAIGSVGLLTWMTNSLALLNKVGAEVSVGQAIGLRDEGAAHHFSTHNLTLSLMIAFVWASLLFTFAPTIISIYELLEEMGIGRVLTGKAAPLFLPCPDRDTGDLLRRLSHFLPDAAPIEGVQCCGLGGCASGKEPEIAASFAQKVGSQHRSTVYTYCASCAGQLRRGGVEGATHVLTEILATHEKPVLSGAQSLWNRARRVL